MVEIRTFDDFAEHARIIGKDGKVIVNPESRDDFVFDVDVKELQRMIAEKPKRQLWTIVEDEDREYICSGYHCVNRMGYVFTKVLVSDPMLASKMVNASIQILYCDRSEK
jgi:hypothetical protein